MKDETIEVNEKIPVSLQISTWLANQITTSPLRSIFIMLLFTISILSGITVHMYNTKEKEREKQIIQIENQWVKIYEKSEKDVIEYKERWIDCLTSKTESKPIKNNKKKK